MILPKRSAARHHTDRLVSFPRRTDQKTAIHPSIRDRPRSLLCLYSMECAECHLFPYRDTSDLYGLFCIWVR